MQNNNAPLIRLAHPLAFAGFLHANGEPPKRLLRQANLPTSTNEAAAWVPLNAAWRFFDLAARAGGPDIGWQVGASAGKQKLTHQLRQTTEQSPTLYEGLKRLIRLIRIESSQLELGIIEGADHILLYTQYPLKDWLGYSASQGYQLAVYINIVRHYCGRNWIPVEIGIEQPTVPSTLRDLYPGTRILGGQQFGYFTISRTDLHKPPPRIAPANIELSEATEIGSMSFPETVTAIAQTYQNDRYLSAQHMASLLNMPERTFYRALAKHKTSYQRLIDEARYNAAKQLLQTSELSLHEIAQATGFNDLSNFSRMFKRIAGLTPGRYRKSLNAD